MRVSRLLMLPAAAAALAGCAQSPPPRTYYAQASDLDMMMYGAPAGYRQQPYGANYGSPPASYRPPQVAAYRAPLPPPSYRPPQSYQPPQTYRPPQTAYLPQTSPPVRQAVQYVPPPDDGPYTLDTGDKLRIVVFGQDTLSNTYAVDAAGMVTMPLIGAVSARDQTTASLGSAIKSKLAGGFIREPSVAVEVETYRPFFVLGEVTYPGQYPYVPHMTAENAVSIAGGFTPRATKSDVTVTRKINGVPARFALPVRYKIRPGDVVTVGERWF